MGTMRTLEAITLALGMFAATAAHAATIESGVVGLKLAVLDKYDLGRAKIVYVAKGAPGIEKGPSNDPPGLNGTAEIFPLSDPSNRAVYSLGDWLVNTDSVAKYVKKTAAPGTLGAKVVVVKPGLVAKLVAKNLGDSDTASGDDSATDLNLQAITDVNDTIRVIISLNNGADGNTYVFCSDFTGLSIKLDNASQSFRVVSKNSTAPSTCASPQTTTTTSTTSTTTTTTTATTPTTLPNVNAVELERDGIQLLKIDDAGQSGLDLAGSDATFEMWVKLESVPPAPYAQFLLQKGNCDGDNNVYYMTYVGAPVGSETLNFHIHNPFQPTNTASILYPVPLQTWTHIAVTYSDALDEVRFYVDGSPVGGPTAFVQSITDSSEAFVIGGSDGTSCGGPTTFDGRFDDVRVWNVARTGAQIATNRVVTLTGTEPNLVAYWRFDGTLEDATSNNNDLQAPAGATYPTPPDHAF